MNFKLFTQKLVVVAISLSLLIPTTPALGSGTIVVDGNANDWNTVPVCEGTDDTAILKVTHDLDSIYFLAKGTLSGPNIQLFIDSDNNINTGFKTSEWQSAGFEMKLQSYIDDGVRKNNLYIYNQGTNNFILSTTFSASLSADGRIFEASVPRNRLINPTDSFRFAFKSYDINWGSPFRLPYHDDPTAWHDLTETPAIDWSTIPVSAGTDDTAVLKVTHDSDSIYFRVNGTFSGPNIQLFIDSDNNINTGFKTSEWQSVGFDMKFQSCFDDNNIRRSNLYIYNQETNDFVLSTPFTASVSADGRTFEATIRRNLLINPADSIRFAFKSYDINWDSPFRLPYHGDPTARYMYNPRRDMTPTNFFEPFSGSSLGPAWTAWGKELACAYSGTIVPTDGIDNSSCFRIELNKTDPWVNSGNRAEIGLGTSEQLHKYEYEFSTLLPSSTLPIGEPQYVNDNGGEIIAQWHNEPDKFINADGTVRTEAWTSPPLALRTAYGNYYLDQRWDDHEDSTVQTLQLPSDAVSDPNSPLYGSSPLSSSGPVSYISDQGKWVNWKFVIRWDWRTNGNGKIEVYKKYATQSSWGDPIKTIIGPNTTNDLYGPTFKFGAYKFFAEPIPSTNTYSTDPDMQWSTITKRVLFFDNIKITEVR